MYANEMLKNNEFYRSLFYSDKGGLYDVLINTFIEHVWKEYKDSIKR